jgi:hypothetical protein
LSSSVSIGGFNFFYKIFVSIYLRDFLSTQHHQNYCSVPAKKSLRKKQAFESRPNDRKCLFYRFPGAFLWTRLFDDLDYFPI